jgi:DNA-binding SARP family transcriptional activator/Cdc6-like AAA superfamily ATPase
LPDEDKLSFLSVSLLGRIHLELDGHLVCGLKNKPLALLAYLVVESNRPHRREALGNLLWPNAEPGSVSNSLRQTLWQLRQAIDGQVYPAAAGRSQAPFLIINRETAQFNPASHYWLDIKAFLTPDSGNLQNTETDKAQIEHLIEIAKLYRGSFLEGFSIKDNYLFEEWENIKREKINQGVLANLRKLTALLEARQDYAAAQVYARQQIEIDPYSEEAYRHLIRNLALDGQRNNALAQYEHWRALVENDLGMQPAEDTIALKAAIQDDALTREPSDYETGGEISISDRKERLVIPFINRKGELARLDGFLKQALAGNGRVAFISGGPGSGKTTLMQEFARHALAAYPDLVPITGNCSTIPEFGILYLPFREILQLLCGDLSLLQSNTILSREYGLRLYSCFPDAIQAVLKRGPDLISAFSISVENLLERSRKFFPGGKDWISRLETLEDRRFSREPQFPLSQAVLIEQYTGVILALSRTHPLIVMIDNLNFKNPDTNGLLFYLGKRLAGSRVLIVAAVQPVEKARINIEATQMMEKMVYEFQRDYGEVSINLDLTDGRDFVNSCINRLPNNLPPDFTERLFHFTGGHALFTVELLQSLQESGILVQDNQGRWIESRQIKWEKLPARIEAVIAKRLSNLPPELKEMLTLASVEGEIFTAEALAQVLEVDVHEIYLRLQLLNQQYHLVAEEGVQRNSTQHFSLYRFRHNLFQVYLSRQLNKVELALSHEKIALALEGLHGWRDALTEHAYDYDIETVNKLVYHFESAQMPLKAARYLLVLGKLAYRLLTIDQAISYFTRGLTLLDAQDDSPECLRLKIDLQFNLGDTLGMLKGWGSAEQMAAFDLAYKLCQRKNTLDQLSSALYRLAHINFGRGDYRKSLLFSEEYFHFAERAENNVWIVQAFLLLGQANMFTGNLQLAKNYLEKFIKSPAWKQAAAQIEEIKGIEPQSYARLLLGLSLLALGYLDQGMAYCREGLKIAQESETPHTVGFILILNCLSLYLTHSQSQAVQPFLDMLIDMWETTEKKLDAFYPWIRFLRGKALTLDKNFEMGIDMMKSGIAENEQVGSSIGRPLQLVALTEAYLEAGQVQAGLDTIAESFVQMEKLNGRFFESTFYRLKGDLLLSGSHLPRPEEYAAVEECYQKAIEIAQRQESKFWELQAVISWARLVGQQGRIDEARQALLNCYAWFSEGFDNPYLVEARDLLEALNKTPDISK